jgi:hypothetical protein
MVPVPDAIGGKAGQGLNLGDAEEVLVVHHQVYGQEGIYPNRARVERASWICILKLRSAAINIKPARSLANALAGMSSSVLAVRTIAIEAVP